MPVEPRLVDTVLHVVGPGGGDDEAGFAALEQFERGGKVFEIVDTGRLHLLQGRVGLGPVGALEVIGQVVNEDEEGGVRADERADLLRDDRGALCAEGEGVWLIDACGRDESCAGGAADKFEGFAGLALAGAAGDDDFRRCLQVERRRPVTGEPGYLGAGAIAGIEVVEGDGGEGGWSRGGRLPLRGGGGEG